MNFIVAVVLTLWVMEMLGRLICKEPIKRGEFLAILVILDLTVVFCLLWKF